MLKYKGRGHEASPPQQKVMIAIAAYEGLGAGCAVSLFMAGQLLQAADIGNVLLIHSGNCSVNDARNEIVSEFLQTDCTDLVFVDADVRFQASDLQKLLSYDRDVVAGIYPKKTDNTEYPLQMFPGDLWTEEDGVLEVMGVPTGFLRIRRNAVETLCKYVAHVRQKGELAPLMPIIFERTTINSYRMTGDFEFCRKWRSLDGKIFVDPEMYLAHAGKQEWEGSLGDHLRYRNGLSNENIDDS